MPKFRGCTIFRAPVIRQRVSLKLYCLVWRRHVGAPLRDSYMAAGNQWKHLEFTLALSTRFFALLNLKTSHIHFFQHIVYSELENITRNDIFVHLTCYPETVAMSRIVKKLTLFSKQSSLPSWRKVSRYLFKNDFLADEHENSKILIIIFSDVTWKPRIEF